MRGDEGEVIEISNWEVEVVQRRVYKRRVVHRVIDRTKFFMVVVVTSEILGEGGFRKRNKRYQKRCPEK